MATETTDYAAVLAFVRRAERRDCILADPALPEQLRTQPGNGALDAGLADAYAEIVGRVGGAGPIAFLLPAGPSLKGC